jgi:predicted nucleic acid-binding protein
LTQPRLRVFLDANVLLSAAYREAAGLLALWQLAGATLMTSGYAAEEARRNLDSEEQRARLAGLLARLDVVPESAGTPLPDGVRLPEKDQPILRAAIACSATHLLTGDWRDFGRWIGHRIGQVRIQTPGEFLRSAGRLSRE